MRGEGVISWESFRRINASLEEPYTHPRNLASGSTRKLDAGEASKRRLEFWAFELVSDHLEPESKLAQQQFLQRSGFSVVPYIFWMPGTASRTSEIQSPAWNPKTSHIRWMVSSWNMKTSATVKALEQPDITRIA